MKILFDHQIFSVQQYGGVSRYFYELANQLANISTNEVKIFSPIYINKYFRNKCNVKPLGVKVPAIIHSRFQRKINSLNNMLTSQFVRIGNDVDIYHETYYSMSDSCPYSAKRVITVYDMIHEKFPEFFPSSSEFLKIKAQAIQRADHVICISESTKQDLISILAVPEDKISVVYLGCSLAMNGDYQRGSSNILCKPNLLYVGSRGGYKNFEKLLHAYSLSPILSKEYNIVCFGGGNFSTKELELIRLLGIPIDCVINLSGNDDVLAGLYSSASALVYPSLYEGFGIPLLEAMAFGCPVVCSNTSSIPEVVGNAAELFDPVDGNEIRLAIERVVSSSQYAAELVEKGLQRIRLFSWEKCAKDTQKVYQKILEE